MLNNTNSLAHININFKQWFESGGGFIYGAMTDPVDDHPPFGSEITSDPYIRPSDFPPTGCERHKKRKRKIIANFGFRKQILPKYESYINEHTNLMYELLYNILEENLDKEISKLEVMGYDLIDKYISGMYTVLLLYNSKEEIYEIALTSDDQEFTTFKSQNKQPSKDGKNPLVYLRDIAAKVKEWLDKYGNLVVGSLNKDRTYKYNQILSRLGFNVGKVSHDLPSVDFPDSWNFTIHK